jgi:endogenous inhibitor of DNA gyrase (YacG/DUF329 family)
MFSVATRPCVYCRRQPAQSPWEPFCSERCKLQDLAKWIDGQYRAPAEPIPDEDVETDSTDQDEDG